MYRKKKSSSKSLSQLIRCYFEKLLFLDIVQHKYVSLDVYLDLLKLNYSHVESFRRLERKGFKNALSQINYSQIFTEGNLSKKTISHSKYLIVDGNKQKITVVYVYSHDEQKIHSNVPWFKDSKNLIIKMPRSWTNRSMVHLTTLPAIPYSTLKEINDSYEPPPAKKQRRQNKQLPSTHETSDTTPQSETYNYWDTIYCRRAFGYYHTDNLDKAALPVEEIVLERMAKMRYGHKHHEGWRQNLEDKDKNNVCTHYDIFTIQMKCKYVSTALRIALKSIHEPDMNWDKCCKKAIDSINLLEGTDDEEEGKLNIEKYRHTNSILNSRTIQKWHLDYRKNNESFKNLTSRINQTSSTPIIFDENPILKDKMMSYCKQNLSNLTCESVHTWFIEEAIPMLANERMEEEVIPAGTLEEYKKMIYDEYNLTKLCSGTVLKWMHQLGFKFSSKTKIYYVDGHEKPEVVEHRQKYINQYIREELLCYRWVQLNEDQVNELEIKNKGFSRNNGYKYINKDTQNVMYEFHVDTHSCIDPFVCDVEYGGFLSVRRDQSQKPLIIFGQDESIYRQYQSNKKRWFLPDGLGCLLPKEQGQGIMYSSFVSRDFGYGMKITEEDLERINNKREFEHYSDCDSAKDVLNGSTKKEKLTTSPFIRTFEYGKNREGYWTYSHMMLQFEDIMDCLTVLFGDKYQYLFYFDNSSGHNKARPDGLCVNNMNKKYGGAQVHLHDTVIKDETYLGEFEVQNKLKVNDVQKFVFGDNDDGPFYLPAEERILNKFDRPVPNETITKDLTTKELIKLINAGTDLNIEGYISYKEAKTTAAKNNIPITKTEPKVIKGWVNQPKGMLQILYERGFIDPNIDIRKYTEKGLKLDDGSLDASMSYKTMTANLPDFIGEQSQLEYIASILGARILSSPKYHPELAGEGIEYCWGVSKGWYRKQKLEDKQNKSLFTKLVASSMSDDVLGIHIVRKCARRMRSYVLAYLCIDSTFATAKCSKEQASTHDNTNTQAHQLEQTDTISATINDNQVVEHCQKDELEQTRTGTIFRNNFTSNNNNEAEESPIVKIEKIGMSCQLVETFVTKFKRRHRSHRNILDQEAKMIGELIGTNLKFVDDRMDSVQSKIMEMK